MNLHATFGNRNGHGNVNNSCDSPWPAVKILTPPLRIRHMCHVVIRGTRRDNVMSIQSREAPTMLQHSTEPSYVQLLSVCVWVRMCAGICAGVCNEPCLLTQFSFTFSCIPQRKRAVWRRAPADDKSEEKCHETPHAIRLTAIVLHKCQRQY